MHYSDSDDDVAGGNDVQEEQWDPRFPQRVLLNSDRTSVILMHRIELNKKRNPILDTLNRPFRSRRTSTGNPYGRDKLPKKFASLTKIFLKDLDAWAEAPAVGKRIELEIIEAALDVDRITLVGQDSNATVARVILYTRNPDRSDAYLQDKIGYGTRIVIGNPLLVKGIGLLPNLNVHNDENLYIHKDRDIGKCRFCTKPGPNPIKCDGCDRVFYCSKRCHELDWSDLKHELVCQNESLGKKQHKDDESLWLTVASVGHIYVGSFIALGLFYYYFVANDFGFNDKITNFVSNLF